MRRERVMPSMTARRERCRLGGIEIALGSGRP